MLAGLAALVLATHVFVELERVRVRPLAVPIPATGGQVVVRLSGMTFPDANLLTPPFALIARIGSQAVESSPFAIAVDGAQVCERRLTPGDARRIDCAVSAEWLPAAAHAVAIQDPRRPGP